MCQQYLSCEISRTRSGGAEVKVLWDTMQCLWASSFQRFEASLFPQRHGKTAQEITGLPDPEGKGTAIL